MDVLSNMNECFGCGACYNICSFNAITFQENDEGFIEPVINDSLCTGCDACRNVCPVLHSSYNNKTNPKIIAFAAEEKLQYGSSSGGAFSILAEYILSKDGIVAGAAFLEDLSVEHIVIDRLEDLDLLRRSKYVQSNPGKCYSAVREALTNNRFVLYSGCPCQVAGLKSFLGKEYNKLVTIDLICHGVPPQKHYFEYMSEKFKPSKVVSVEMRRRKGWGTCFKADLSNGTTYIKNSKKDTFLKAFLEDINLRRSCYGCAYACVPRQGDITLGDLWVAKHLKLKPMPGNKKSLVLLNSDKGEQWWNDALCSTTWEIVFDDLTKKNTVKDLNKNVSQPTVYDMTKRDAFMRLYPKLGFEKATIQSLFPYNVGLVLYMSDNFGSVATNYALYKAIEHCGYSPVIFDNLTQPEGISKNFIEKYLSHIGTNFDRNDYRAANVMCESFVVGSDQSWRWDFRLTIKNLEYFLMSFASLEKRKIAYAASFGKRRNSLDSVVQRFYAQMLLRFDAISVREDYAVDMCKTLFGINAVQVADPVFLPERGDYIALSRESKLKFEEPFLFAYIRFPSPEKRQLIRESAKQLGVRAIVSCDANGYEKFRKLMDMDEVIDKPEFVDWLAFYVNADYIITDSFHGTCFSLILQKKFIAIKAGTRERFDSLAAIIDGPDKGKNSGFYDNAEDLLGKENNFIERDFAEISSRLDDVRSAGLCWLKESLSLPKKDSIALRESVDNNVDYARLVRRYIQSGNIERRYAYNEQVRAQRAGKIKTGNSFLQAQRAVVGLRQLKKDSCTNIKNLGEYFSYLKGRNCTIFLSAKDDCSRYWQYFIKASKLPLKIKPEFHDSYLAVIYDSNLVFEKASKNRIQKHYRVLPPSSVIRKVFALFAHRGRMMNVYMLSKGYNREIHDEKSIIMVNNVDYSLDKRGINIVVIDNSQKEVIDSFNVDLYDNSSLSMVRS